MKAIETVLTMNEHGIATLRMPPGVTPGEHKVVVVIEEESKKAKVPLSFPRHDIGPWPFGPNESFRREDLYDDDDAR